MSSELVRDDSEKKQIIQAGAEAKQMEMGIQAEEPQLQVVQ
jgi:hypothetical protein